MKKTGEDASLFVALHIEEAPVARPLISENQICESGGYKKQDQHYDRHDIADHEAVQTGTFEMLAVSFYFTDDPVRSDHPADQNTGQQRNKRHQEAARRNHLEVSVRNTVCCIRDRSGQQ